MKCFYHSQSDAVGICKNCQKGICFNCAVDLKDGIACKDKCEIQAKEVIELISNNRKIIKTFPKNQKNNVRAYLVNSIIPLSMGICFLIYGVFSILYEPIGYYSYFLIIMGIIFFIGGIFNFIITQKAKNLRKEIE